jgi:hypothetical protein
VGHAEARTIPRRPGLCQRCPRLCIGGSPLHRRFALTIPSCCDSSASWT